MPQTVLLDRRLMAVANYVRNGAVFADIGTDHAYLPVFLLQNGMIRHAVAADINQGPIDRAITNISAYGLIGKVDTFRTDGLNGLDGRGITDIAICGMGGELIVKIIKEAPMTRQKGMRLILQPMTKSEVLREYLITNGYEIVDETLAETDRIYQIICVEYTGENTVYTNAELLIGKCNIEKKSDLLYKQLNNIKSVFTRVLDAKSKSGHETVYENEILNEVEKLL